MQELLDARLTASLAAQVGRRTGVLIEGQSKRTASTGFFWKGRDPAGRIVNLPLPEGDDHVGRIVTARILQAKKHSLIGEAEALDG